jgi:hypothetical protein
MKAPTPGSSLRSEGAEASVAGAAVDTNSEFVPPIKVNTVGYPPGWRKIGIFNVEPI